MTPGPARPLRKVLVANRGEIAVRVIRGCRAEGLNTVALWSDPDRKAPHVRMADEAVHLPGTSPGDTYLSIERVLDAARATGADAVHPGYGFLSENAAFAEACEAAGLTFVGPSGATMRLMGAKDAARRAMSDAGVPIVPGTREALRDAAAARQVCDEIGYPVMLKAIAGGGGKGIRVVRTAEAVTESFERASSEAQASFGDGRVYVEKLVASPRHIEIQVLCDGHGNGVHLGERECSLQRRHQKVVEEAPSSWLPDATRQAMGAAALRGALSVGYTNAGTMEFLLDPAGNFYFLEMNTRLQVEHTVTEMVYGIDLVREQLRIAAGAPLSLTQDQVTRRGHAIEVRLCAEDPEQGFFPSAGVIEHLNLPGGPGVRLDVGVYEGQEITLHYDSMIGKLVCWGGDRGQALARLQEALRECVVAGIGTNVPFLRRLLRDPAIVEGRYDTGYIDAHLSRLTGKGEGHHRFAAAVAAVLVHRDRARSRAANGSAQRTGAAGGASSGASHGASDSARNRPSPWTLLGRPGGPR